MNEDHLMDWKGGDLVHIRVPTVPVEDNEYYRQYERPARIAGSVNTAEALGGGAVGVVVVEYLQEWTLFDGGYPIKRCRIPTEWVVPRLVIEEEP